MKASENRKRDSQAGFSMIEVLVASSILVVIVMMLGMLFQQTSLAWRTGIVRAEGFMRLRSVIGTIQRDAAAAIDERASVNGQWIEHLDKKFSDKNGHQSFNSGELSFYTLTGTDESRALTHISHSTDGTRKQMVLDADGSWGTEKTSQVKTFLTGNNADNAEVEITGFEFPDSYVAGTLPSYVIVNAAITTKGMLYEIGAASAGPDGEFGTSPTDPRSKDDIKTWVDKP